MKDNVLHYSVMDANGLVLQSQTKDVDEISSAVCYNTC